VAQQRHVPYIIDITTSDVPTHSVAQSVREGKQKVQYVYRIFPSSTKAGPLAVKYMTEIFQETKTFPKRVVVMYTNDVFGKGQSEGFIKAVEAAKPGFEIVGVIPYPELANDLSTEVSRAKSLKPDVLSPVTRPATAILLLQELAKQRVELMGIISPGAPGLNEPRQVEILKENIEYVMNNAPWPNLSNPRVQKIAEAYLKRYGKPFDTASGYTYEAILVMADALERAKSTDPDAIVDAIKKTSLDGITIASGPIRFDENGDNQNAATSMIQILKGKPLVVRPKEVAQAQVVFPRPKV
jgi:branched-chain amino acid transport system substrate-binding protein